VKTNLKKNISLSKAKAMNTVFLDLTTVKNHQYSPGNNHQNSPLLMYDT